MNSVDPSFDFILDGIRNGFIITDPDQIPNYVELDNYKSATCLKNKKKVELQIKCEIDNLRYIIPDFKPKIVSALGAIEKKNSDSVRLIHDCSCHVGNAVNDFYAHDPFRYQSLQDAVDLIKPCYFLAKLDLASAYRSVRIHPSNYTATGLKWTFDGDTSPTYLVDTRLPFGASASPGIFHQLGQAVRHMLKRLNVRLVVNYLDDYLLMG